jgi:hypothetical protein
VGLKTSILPTPVCQASVAFSSGMVAFSSSMMAFSSSMMAISSIA